VGLGFAIGFIVIVFAAVWPFKHQIQPLWNLSRENPELVQFALDNPEIMATASYVFSEHQETIESLLKEFNTEKTLRILDVHLDWVENHAHNLFYKYLAYHEQYQIVYNREVDAWNNATEIDWYQPHLDGKNVLAWAAAQPSNVLLLQWKGAGHIPGVLLKNGDSVMKDATKFVRFITDESGKFSGKILLLHPNKTGVFSVPKDAKFKNQKLVYATW